MRTPANASAPRRPRSTRQARFALRPVSLAACLMGAAPMGLALPQGPVQTQGQAQVSVTAPGQMAIVQTTPRAGLDWTSFSIAAGERVSVQQPGSSSVLLNRVLGNDPSHIHGALTSNGQVWLVNPRGIVFGAQSRVDVGGLVATTLSVTDDALAAGRLQLGTAGGADAGALRSEGRITAGDGSVVLVAPQLLHSGTIQARRVGLAAASEVLVDVEGDGLVFFNVRNDRLQARLDVLGNVLADGGHAELRAAARAGLADTVLNVDGIVQARSLGMRDGRIVVDGGTSGITRVAGTLDATGAGADARGGRISVEGEKIGLVGNARLDASGSAGGGAVFVGGGFQGQDATLRNARMVSVGPDAALAANAGERGDGGTVIVWSDDATRFHGRADARGGATGGDGGLVEVSGKAYLDYRGSSDRSAPMGRAGVLLLDPTNLTIASAGANIDDSPAPGGGDLSSGTLLFGAPGTNSVITAGAVQTQLAAGPVQLQAEALINVNAAITSASGNNLTLRAGGSINVNQPISVTGALTLSAGDAGATAPVSAAGVTVEAALSAGGTLTLGAGGSGVHEIKANLSGQTLSVTGGILLSSASTWTLANDTTLANTVTGSAALSKAGAGVLTLSGASGYTGAVILNAGGFSATGALGSTSITANAGTFTVGALDALANGAALTVANGATLSMAASDQVTSLALGGTLSGAGTLTTSGTTTLNAGALVAAPLSANALVGAGNATITAAASVTTSATVNSGTLTVGDGTTNGSLSAATITVNTPGVLAYDRNDTHDIGAIAGNGTLRQAGSGRLQLTSATGQVTTAVDVAAGTLALTGANLNLIADASSVTVGNGATLAVGNTSETISALTLNGGGVEGSGTLTVTNALTSTGASQLRSDVSAGSVAVNGGTLVVGNGSTAGTLTSAGANIASGAVLAYDRSDNVTLGLTTVSGAGALRQTGSADLRVAGGAGQVASGALEASAGRIVLLTGQNNRIADTTPVALSGNAQLVLENASETIASLALTGSGGVGGSGTLSTTGALTSSGTATLATAVNVGGTATVSAGTLTVGSAGIGSLSATGGITVTGGSLALADGGSGDRLGNTTAVTVSAGNLALASDQDETVGNVVLSGGTLTTSTRRLTSGTGSYTLSGGSQVNANLGTGTIDVTGAATLDAGATATAVIVRNGQTLTLGSNADLAAGATVTVETGATLTLGAASDTVTTLALAGTLAGGSTRTLAATTHTLQDGAVVNARLGGTGTINSSGAVALNQPSTATTVNVNTSGSTLTLGGADLLANTAAVTVAAGATLALGGDDTIGALTLAGTVSGSGTLGAASLVANGAAAALRAALTTTGNASVSSGVLTVGDGAGNGSLGVGGTLTVASGAVLAYANNTPLTLSQNILGGGTLRHTGSAALTLDADADAIGAVQVFGSSSFTLANGNNDRLANGATVTVNSGATFALGNSNETVGTLVLAGGTLGAGGGGRLSAGNYDLQAGAVVNGTLGAGTLATSGNGTVTLGAAVDALTINVGAGSTLAIGASAGLVSGNNGANISVAGTGRLRLSRDVSVQSLSLAGTLDSTGTAGAPFTLTTVGVSQGGGTTLAAGGLIDTNARLDGGRLTVTGDATLAGRTLTNVRVNNGGILRLSADSSDHIVDSATVTLVSGSTIQLAAGVNEIVTEVTGPGAIVGPGTLNPGTYRLEDGDVVPQGNTVNVGQLVSDGTTSILGTVSVSGSATVNTGTLTVGNGSNGSLAVGGGITINGGATLAYNRSSLVTLSTAITGAGTLRQAGSGELRLSSTADVGAITIASGSLSLTTGNNDRIGDTTAVTLTGGTLQLNNASETVGNLALGGTLVGGALTAATVTLNTGANVNAALTSAAGTVTVAGNAALGASGNLADGTTLVIDTGSTFTLGASDTIAQLDLSGTLAGTGTLTATAGYALTGGSTTANAHLGTGTLTSSGSSQLAGTSAAGSVAVGGGTLTLASASRLTAVPTLTVASGATLAVTGAQTVGSTTIAGTLQGSGSLVSAATIGVQAGANLQAALTAPTLAVSGSATLAAAADVGTVDVTAGTLTLSGANRLADGATVNVASGATLALGGNDTIAQLNLSGQLGGSGTLSATTGYQLAGASTASGANLGSGVLTTTGATLLAGSAAATAVNVDSGTLTLASADRLSSAAVTTLALGSTLALGGDTTLGSLAGSGNVALGGFTLATGAAGSSSYAGQIGGNGALVKQGAASTFILGAAQAWNGTTTVAQGTLRLSGANQLPDSSAVTVASAATLELGGNDTVASLALSGSLTGSGTLTATALSGYTLSGGSTAATANLGTGALTSSGSSTLAGGSAASTVTVSGGTLTLVGAERLSDGAAVSVAGGATLALGGAERVGTLALGGTLAAGQTLSATSATLQAGATVHGNLALTGALAVGGNATLNGTASAGSVAVNAGTLTLAATPGRLAGAPAVTVAGGATLQVGAAETVASLDLAGTLSGAGSLGGASAVLRSGSSVAAALGTTLVTVTGNSTLSGTIGGTTLAIDAGTLTTTAGDRIGNGTAVGVAAGATLQLGGSDTVASLALSGTLTGNATLTATSGYTLSGGSTTTNTHLGAGTLTSTGSSQLGGTAAATTVNVDAGTLTLAGADRLANTATVTVATGATLALGGNDTIGALVLSGTLQGSGTLTAGSYALGGGTAGAALGAGALTSTGSSVLAATSAATSVAVDGGTLSVSGSFGAAPVTTVASGATLALPSSTTLGSLAGGGSVALANGALLTTGSAGSTTFAGTIGGDGALTKVGAATTFTLAGANTYTGATTVSAGTLATAGADVLPDASAVTVATGATLALGGHDTVQRLVLAGTLTGGAGITLSADATLTPPTGYGYTLAGGTANARLGAGTLQSTGSSTLAQASGADVVDITSGTLTLAAGDLLSDNAVVTVAAPATLTLNGDDTVRTLAVSGTVGGTGVLSASNYVLTGGIYNLNLGGGLLTSSGASFLNGSSLASEVQVIGGTLTLVQGNTLRNAPLVTVDAGATLALGGAETFGALAGSGHVDLGSAVLTTGSLASSSFGGSIAGGAASGLVKAGSATTFTLAGSASHTGSTQVAAGTLLVEGTLASPAIAVAGGATLTLAAAERLADTAQVNVAAGGTLNVAATETIGRLDLAGLLSGSGTLGAGTVALDGGTAGAALGPGALTSTGTSTLTATAAVGSVTVTGGRLTLATAQQLTALPAVSVAGGATLALGAGQTIGSLAGAGQVDLAGATLATGGAGSSRFDGVIASSSGAGALVKQGAGTTFTLGGANTYAGTTTVAAGTLALDGAGRLAGGGVASVAGGATLQLGGDQSLAGLTLAGTLAGSGTFTAPLVTLAGGSVQAALGTGAISSSGNSTLNAASAAHTVDVAGGSLTIGSQGLLSAAPAVDVAGGAVLALGSAQTIGRLSGTGQVTLGNHVLATGSGGDSSFGGTIGGSGGLLKQGTGTFTLSGDHGYTGATTVAGGTLALSGTLASGSVRVDAGELSLASGDRLADGAVLNVASGAVLRLSGADTVGALMLAGTLAGSGTLNAATVQLDGGTVLANLGAGQLDSSGSSRLDGSSAAGHVRVNGGTLTLGSAARLVGTPEVTVAGGATLALGGDEAIGRLAGSGSVALGSATLTTGSGGDSSFAGVIAGGGGLVKQGASSFTLAGANTYTGATTVAGGTLALAGADRLADTGSVGVASGATLQIGGNQRLASLQLAGTLAGSGVLQAASTTLDGGTANAELGGGTLASRGNSTLGGRSAASVVTVDSGTLVVGSADALSAAPATTVAGGATLRLLGGQTLGLLSGAGTLEITAGALATGAAGDSTFGGAIVGGGSLVKQGSGSFALTGNHGYTGATTVAGGTLLVDGTLASTTLAVDAGRLQLGAAERLADGAAVSVASGAALQLAGDERIGTLALAGTLSGSGRLSATGYTLDGATVIADLGSGSFTSRGATRLDGTLGAETVTVAAGTLTLGAAHRLADGAAVTIDPGAALQLGGDDTVATLAVRGTLGGSGTLTATQTLLDGGRVDADLGAGALTSRGSAVLAGRAAVNRVDVETGTLTLIGADRFGALPAVTVAAPAAIVLGGDTRFGTLAGAGSVALGTFTLGTGDGGDSTFAGVLGGSGGLIKHGASSTFTLTGSNAYTGATTVAAGTLRIGDGGSGGSAAGSSQFDVQGTLVIARSDALTLAQPIAGNGQVVLDLADTGRVTFSGGNKTHAGGTTVQRGTLATAGADQLPDTGTVTVAAPGALALGGSERVGAVDADGTVTLGGDLSAGQALLLRGAVTVAGGGAVTLAGTRIDAVHAGNRWGSRVSIAASDAVTLNAGSDAGTARDLVLGSVDAGNGGRIEAGRLTLDGALTLSGGTLELAAAAPAAVAEAEPALAGKQVVGQPIAFAEDVVTQTARVDVASGALLKIEASGGGSVLLDHAENNVAGRLAIVTGSAADPWTLNVVNAGGTRGNVALQSRVRLDGRTVNVGDVGIVGDVLHLRAERMATVDPDAALVARMPFDPLTGTASTIPGLTLELAPGAFTTQFPFGERGEGGLRVNVGSVGWGNRTALPLNAGYISVLPRGGAQGDTAVLLIGPQVGAGGYRVFVEGARRSGEIPVSYNGLLPATPAAENSISATVAVSEGARKERFEEAVRTENVAVRLRAGVIAEVGPAPSATLGTEGVRPPPVCPPGGGQGLACAKAP
jgi:filamentous hemagglutinin family protein